MKRFWREAQLQDSECGHEIRLDGRAVRTPRGALLQVPTLALAQAIAAEWDAVDGEIRPGAMPMTGLANAAIDLVPADRPGFVGGLAAYAESDLTCYRAEGPQPLVARQVAAWEPVLKSVEARHGLLFRRTVGVMHVAQPVDTLRLVEALLMGLDDWTLAPLQPLVTLSGSVVLALAVLEGVVNPCAAYAAATVDERWQAEQWGVDSDAAARLADRQRAFETAAAFLALAGGDSGNFAR